MEPPRHPAGPAFEKASDEREAWRQQQIALLGKEQEKLYKQAVRKTQEREEAQARELATRKKADIHDRARQKLLDAPRLELNIHGRRITMSKLLADRLIARHLRQGSRSNGTLAAQLVRQAVKAATAEIAREHARQLEQFRDRGGTELDELLRSFERGRESQPKHRDEFSRAATLGRAKTDFERAAQEDGQQRRSGHGRSRKRRR